MTVRFARGPDGAGPRFAYALGRRTGGAVVRNRLRRRMRAVIREIGPTLPAGAYVVSAGPQACGLGYEELRKAMSQALERATVPRGPRSVPRSPSAVR